MVGLARKVQSIGGITQWRTPCRGKILSMGVLSGKRFTLRGTKTGSQSPESRPPGERNG